MNVSTAASAKRVRFYFNETDQTAGTATVLWLMEFLRKRNAAGATVMRCGMGFGVSGRVHTLHVVDLAIDLPVIVEWIDDEARVNLLLPEISAQITPGLITVEDTTIALRAQHSIRDVSSKLTVAAVMTKAPTCVDVNASAREIVELMQRNQLRAIPVVEQRIVVGIVTGGDLLSRAGLGARLSHFPGLQPNEVSRQLDQLRPMAAREIMSSPAVSVSGEVPLSQAAAIMVLRKFKRLPVVDEGGALIGILSRIDVLRTVTRLPSTDYPTETGFCSSEDEPLEQVMRRDVPTVFPDTLIHQVLQAIISTRLNLALVVDADRHVLGTVTSVELLQRITPDLRPRTIATLLHRLPLFHPSSQQAESRRHALAHNAHELMTHTVVTAKPTMLLREVIETMVTGAHKVVAVVDDDGKLLGVVDRADVLRGLLRHCRLGSSPAQH